MSADPRPFDPEIRALSRGDLDRIKAVVRLGFTRSERRSAKRLVGRSVRGELASRQHRSDFGKLTTFVVFSAKARSRT